MARRGKKRHREQMHVRRVIVGYLRAYSEQDVPGGKSFRYYKRIISRLFPAFADSHQKMGSWVFLKAFYDSIDAKKQTPPEEGFVYIVGNRKYGFCKIGRSKNPEKRLSEIQTGCPFDLTILALFENRGAEFEQRLQHRARPYHERGEWFRIEGRLKDFLDQ